MPALPSKCYSFFWVVQTKQQSWCRYFSATTLCPLISPYYVGVKWLEYPGLVLTLHCCLYIQLLSWHSEIIPQCNFRPWIWSLTTYKRLAWVFSWCSVESSSMRMLFIWPLRANLNFTPVWCRLTNASTSKEFFGRIQMKDTAGLSFPISYVNRWVTKLR